MDFTNIRPKVSGYYYVIWQQGDSPVLIWINFIPKGTLFKGQPDDRDYWTWGYTENDDPENIELDLSDPNQIMFSKV